MTAINSQHDPAEMSMSYSHHFDILPDNIRSQILASYEPRKIGFEDSDREIYLGRAEGSDADNYLDSLTIGSMADFIIDGTRVASPSSLPTTPLDETAGGRRSEDEPIPIPEGMITRLDENTFKVKTRRQCRHTFEYTVQSNDIHVAEEVFRKFDAYDPSLPRLKERPAWLNDLRFGLGQLRILPKSSAIDAPRSGGLKAWLSGTRRKNTETRANPSDLELARGATEMNAMPGAQREHTPSDVGDVPTAAANAVQSNNTANPLTHFICVVLGDGQPTQWRLTHIPFTNPQESRTNEALFRAMRAHIGHELGKRWVRQLLLPYKVGSIEYSEFEIYNQTDLALRVANAGKDEHNKEFKYPTDSVNWEFDSISTLDDMKKRLGKGQLSHNIKNPGSIEPFANYWAWIPRKKERVLGKSSNKDVTGWGIVVNIEFNYVTFACVWSVLVFVMGLAFCLALAVPKHSPLHGNVGVVAIFFGMFWLFAMFYTVVYKITKHQGVLK